MYRNTWNNVNLYICIYIYIIQMCVYRCLKSKEDVKTSGLVGERLLRLLQHEAVEGAAHGRLLLLLLFKLLSL